VADVGNQRHFYPLSWQRLTQAKLVNDGPGDFKQERIILKSPDIESNALLADQASNNAENLHFIS
jgi:hypothetical protein